MSNDGERASEPKQSFNLNRVIVAVVVLGAIGLIAVNYIHKKQVEAYVAGTGPLPGVSMPSLSIGDRSDAAPTEEPPPPTVSVQISTGVRLIPAGCSKRAYLERGSVVAEVVADMQEKRVTTADALRVEAEANRQTASCQ